MKKIAALNIRRTLQSAPPVLDFVLPGLTAGSVGTVVGAGAVGKTTMLMQLGVALATGSAVFDGLANNGNPARVVFVAAEESADILRIRLHAINNWMLSNKAQVSLPGSESAIDATDLMEANLFMVAAAGQAVSLLKNGVTTDFFSALCEFCKGARLVIIDPLRRLHDGDENSSAAMTDVVQILEALAKQTGAAVIVAHHVNKASHFNDSGNSAGASRGSSALTDAVRWQLNLSGMSEKDAKAFRITGQHKSYLRVDFAKANYIAPEPTIWLRRQEGGVLTRIFLEAGATEKGSFREVPKKTTVRSGQGKVYV